MLLLHSNKPYVVTFTGVEKPGMLSFVHDYAKLFSELGIKVVKQTEGDIIGRTNYLLEKI